MGVAHPDWPFHSAETRAEYEFPTGRWWVQRGLESAHWREVMYPHREKVAC
jgi:hypothetical protein